MDKRNFIKKGLTGLVGVAAMPYISKSVETSSLSVLKTPKIPYSFASFGKFASERGMKDHFHFFYKAQVNQLEQNIAKLSFRLTSVRQIFRNTDKFSSELLEQAGNYYNHKLFWKTISPSGSKLTNNSLKALIIENFGSLNQFQKEFESAALSLSGSGWVWLTASDRQLKIITTADNTNPLFASLPKQNQGFPLFGLDMWEHAYYTDHTFNKKNYTQNFWEVLNWDFVSKRYSRITSYRNEFC